MNKRRVRVILFVSLVVVGFFFLRPETESFYLKALQEGKTYYDKSQYEQAINLLKIAEFGLLEEKKYLAELYLYYTLSCYKLGRINESRGILDKLKTELNIKELNTMTIPPQIENDVKVMLAVLEKYDNPASWNGLKNLTLIDRFESRFLKALDHLKNGNLTGVEEEIKGLMLLNKRDARIPFLKGVSAFNKKKYGKCIGYLNKITNSIDPVYKDEVFYYLSLSYSFEKKNQQADFYSRMIRDKALQEKLYNLIQYRRKQ